MLHTNFYQWNGSFSCFHRISLHYIRIAAIVVDLQFPCYFANSIMLAFCYQRFLSIRRKRSRKTLPTCEKIYISKFDLCLCADTCVYVYVCNVSIRYAHDNIHDKVFFCHAAFNSPPCCQCISCRNQHSSFGCASKIEQKGKKSSPYKYNMNRIRI